MSQREHVRRREGHTTQDKWRARTGCDQKNWDNKAPRELRPAEMSGTTRGFSRCAPGEHAPQLGGPEWEADCSTTYGPERWFSDWKRQSKY